MNLLIFQLIFLQLICSANSLYFFLTGNSPRCFSEELSRESTVVASYDAQEWKDSTNTFETNHALGIQITVDHVQSNSRLVNQKGDNSGKFAFTSHDSGEHIICLSSNTTSWFGGSQRTKLTLDLMFGDSSHPSRSGGLDSGTKKVLDDLSVRIRSVNDKVHQERIDLSKGA